MKRLILGLGGCVAAASALAQTVGPASAPAITPELMVAAFSAVFAGIAVGVAVAGFMRGRAAAQSELFLTLRTRFIDIHEHLPEAYADENWSPGSAGERAATIRYWHHAFDEWYITTQLNAYARILWTKYFRHAQLSGLKHPGLRAVALEITSDNLEIGTDWRVFRRELDRMWSTTHTNEATRCSGIDCQHHGSGDA